MYDEDFACERKELQMQHRIEQLKNEGREDHVIAYAERQNQEELIRKGCNNIVQRPRCVIDNINYYKCLCQFKHPQFNTLLTYIECYDTGNLPFEGSVGQQPNQIMELIQIVKHAIEIEKLHMQNKQAEKSRKKGR